MLNEYLFKDIEDKIELASTIKRLHELEMKLSECPESCLKTRLIDMINKKISVLDNLGCSK